MSAMLRYDPVPFVLNRGPARVVLSLLGEAGLLFTALAREYLLVLLSQQRPDGGFPSALDADHSGVLETERSIHLLLQAGLGPSTLNVSAALGWILGLQHADGGWSENPALYIPPHITHLDATVGVTWLTAEVLCSLQEAGYDSEDAYWRGLDWLYGRHCSRWGWPLLDGQDEPDPDSSTQITFLLRNIYGEEDEAVRGGLQYYERCLSQAAQDAQQRYYEVRGERRGLDVYHLADTVFDARAAAAGYDLSDDRLASIVDALIDIQRRDGGWRPYWMEESDPFYTVYTLRALVWVGALERESLADMVRRYTR
ncbi:MAG: terpene cyclase/mutase family protein [Chloroflexia bacterium]|nr:terpene cyclase/mutase family protein [Chloroflexia bacterium]